MNTWQPWQVRTQRKSMINKRKEKKIKRNLQKIELEKLLEPQTVNVFNFKKKKGECRANLNVFNLKKNERQKLAKCT